MKPDTFTTYLRDPEKMDSSVLMELEGLIREYPFCQPARLLRLRGLQLAGDGSYDSQLKFSAIHAADRRVLYDRLTASTGPYEEISTEPQTGEKSGLVKEIEALLPLLEPDLLRFDFSDTSGEEFPIRPLPVDSVPTTGIHSMRVTSPMPEMDFRIVPKRTSEELIDRFIDDPAPKIVRPDTGASHDNDISASSLREDDEFLTETLARIYVQQGYYLKAIQAYEKLSLKIPEKSIYFAGQIEIVRQLIKNQ